MTRLPLRISATFSTGMMIWPKYSSTPSILTRRSMASLIDSSRPLCTLTTYQCLLPGQPGTAPGLSPCSSSFRRERFRRSRRPDCLRILEEPVRLRRRRGHRPFFRHTISAPLWAVDLMPSPLRSLLLAVGTRPLVRRQDNGYPGICSAPGTQMMSTDEKERGQQQHGHQHHDRVLHQGFAGRPRHLVHLRFGGDQKVGERREIDDPPGQPKRRRR